jgi:hypothetical protein
VTDLDIHTEGKRRVMRTNPSITSEAFDTWLTSDLPAADAALPLPAPRNGDPMTNRPNRTTSDLRTVRELLNQAARRDIMPSTQAALRLAALALGGELMSDTISPLSDRQWGAMATLLDLVPSEESIRAALRQGAGQ